MIGAVNFMRIWAKKQCEIVIFANKYVPTSYDLCDECYLELAKWLVEKKAKHV